MNSDLPKVLHPIGGSPMLQLVIDSVKSLGDTSINVVIGHGAGQVESQVEGNINFVLQEEQLGTGHAVAQVLPSLREGALCLILYGDVPLIQPATLQRLINATPDQSMGMLTVSLDDSTGYGRIIRDASGKVTSIVEQKDASEEQLRVSEINTGIMAVNQQQLSKWLPKLSNENAQGEYYLTDIVAMAVADEISVNTVSPSFPEEVEGVNDKRQLAALERVYQRNKADELMQYGVTLADPSRIDIRGKLTAGKDVFIDVNCVFNGSVELGNGVHIGPNAVISNAKIADGATVYANCVIEDSEMLEDSMIGPFGRLRPGVTLGRSSKVGNFVEMKNTTLGAGSKANHLAYIGDTVVGEKCNIGAGTITCNYDGAKKYKTNMGDNVFVGSNSTLVAPLSLSDNAFVGAGSTITTDIDTDELGIGRSKQRNIKGWKRPTKDST